MEYIGAQLNTAECNSSVIYWSSMIVADSEDVAVPADSADSGDSPDCVYICIYVCMYICIYVYMYICMYADSVYTGDPADSVDSAHSGDSADYTAPVAYNGVPWDTSESNLIRQNTTPV